MQRRIASRKIIFELIIKEDPLSTWVYCFQDGALVKKYRSSEGKVRKIPYKGPVETTILDILGGLRSTGTYIGARRLKDFPKCTTFIEVHQQVNTVFDNIHYLT